jgi:hypothetical protein
MKTIEQIAIEVIAQVPKSFSVYNANGKYNWKTYYSIFGFEKENYVGLYFTQNTSGDKEIEISQETTEPQKYIDIIKAIEPKSKIIFYKKEYKKNTI